MNQSTEPDERHLATGSRHLSMRLPESLYVRLEQLASDSHESVSQCVRRLLSDGLAGPDSSAIDEVIATLQMVRGHLDRTTTEVPVTPVASKTVNVLNAKTDLQHLIEDVARGVEIIITHAGTQRARLVPVSAQGAS